MSDENSGTITIKKDALWKYSTFALLGILVIGALFFILPGKNPTGNVINEGANEIEAKVKVALLESDHILGDPNAPVIMVEYSDFECPYCARYHAETFDLIKSNYIDTGKVALVFRHFPLSFHPNAQKAAEASECAADQGKFWEMQDMLFDSGVEGGIPTLVSYATSLGLDVTKFSECLNSGEKADKTNADMAQGQKDGVEGTPGFFIGQKGKEFTKISGAYPYATFEEAIKAEL